jgi:hypothetical protein
MSYIASVFAAISFVASTVSAVYVHQHRLAVQQSTCHWQMGAHHDETLHCTRELAICEISPYLLKPDVSEKAVWGRRKACGQLVCFSPFFQ